MQTLDIATFRAMFPEFANATDYPDASIELNYDASTDYISTSDYGVLAGKSRTRALYLLTAHFFKINEIVASGETTGMVSGASIDKVSVTLTPPNNASQLDWWLNLTSYGQQLLALLQMRSKGGFYVGGSAVRANFRKPDGSF